MAIAGAKPKPVELKILEGNPGKRPLPNVVKSGIGRLRPPVDLPTESVEFWHKVVPELRRLGLLSKLDEQSVADYCLCLARLKEAEKLVSENGLLVEGERGLVKNPASQAAREYRQAIQRWTAEFGLTPSSRTRLAMPEQPSENEFTNLLD